MQRFMLFLQIIITCLLNVWLVYKIEIVTAKVPNLVLKGKQDQCDLIIYELTLAGLIMFL